MGLSSVLSLVVVSATAVSALRCGADPLVLPVTDVTLRDGQKARGVPMGLGTPKQPFAMRVSPAFQNTMVKMTTDSICKTKPAAQCEASRGGGYWRAYSETWDGPLNKDAYRGDKSEQLDAAGEDVLHFAGGTFDKFPFGQRHYKDFSFGALGMGVKSVLLDFLDDEQVIPSKSWSYYHGRDIGDKRDGHFIIGGYDEKKRGDQAHVADVSVGESHCILAVKLKELVMKEGDTSYDLLGGSGLTACLRPDYTTINMPKSVFERFNSKKGGIYDDLLSGVEIVHGGYRVPASKAFKGSLKVTLDSGRSFEIDNSQLVADHMEYNDKGQPIKASDDKVLRMYSSSSSDVVSLGIPFFSAIHLWVDMEEFSFAVSPVVHSSETKLIRKKGKGCTDDKPKQDIPKTDSNGSSSDDDDKGKTTTTKKPSSSPGESNDFEVVSEDNDNDDDDESDSNGRGNTRVTTSKPQPKNPSSQTSLPTVPVSSVSIDPTSPGAPSFTVVTQTLSPTGSSSEESQSEADEKSQSNINGAAIGGGIGGGLALIALAVFAFLFYRRKDKRERLSAPLLEGGMGPGPAGYDARSISTPEKPPSAFHAEAPATVNGYYAPQSNNVASAMAAGAASHADSNSPNSYTAVANTPASGPPSHNNSVRRLPVPGTEAAAAVASQQAPPVNQEPFTGPRTPAPNYYELESGFVHELEAPVAELPARYSTQGDPTRLKQVD